MLLHINATRSNSLKYLLRANHMQLVIPSAFQVHYSPPICQNFKNSLDFSITYIIILAFDLFKVNTVALQTAESIQKDHRYYLRPDSDLADPLNESTSITAMSSCPVAPSVSRQRRARFRVPLRGALISSVVRVLPARTGLKVPA